MDELFDRVLMGCLLGASLWNLFIAIKTGRTRSLGFLALLLLLSIYSYGVIRMVSWKEQPFFVGGAFIIDAATLIFSCRVLDLGAVSQKDKPRLFFGSVLIDVVAVLIFSAVLAFGLPGIVYF